MAAGFPCLNGERLSAVSNGIPNDGTSKSVHAKISSGSASAPTDSNSSGTEVRPEPDGRSDSVDDANAQQNASNPRDLLSARPFVRAAKLWRDAGWIGTIPLPARQKNPPPTGWTGRAATFPDNSQISEWSKLAQYRKGNIGLHLGFPVIVNGTEYEVIGVDVDDYEDNGKIKTGGRQLKLLEKDFGRLPRTWVSTARAGGGDFTSGIRFFLVPRGLAFRGQVDKDIEVIQKSHRFAVVWPSYNPKSDSQYALYSPDSWAHSSKRAPVPSHEIPDVTTLPVLPEKWIDYLTNGRMRDTGGEIDMDSSQEEIEAWARETFNDSEDMCYLMRKATGEWKSQITDEATSHDKIRDAHWQLINLGAEGHTGWDTAVTAIDRHWIDDVMSRSKRQPHEMRMEMWRSRINGLRKVKVKVENATSRGMVYTLPECACVARDKVVSSGGPGGDAGGFFISDADAADLNENGPGGPPDGLEHVGWGNSKSPDEYEQNDDGNGEFLCDLLRYKHSRVKWIEGHGWIVWTDAAPGRPSRWLTDTDGLVRRAFWRVKQLQEAFATDLEQQRDQMMILNQGVTPLPPALIALKAAAKSWRAWAEKSGNNRQANNAIDAAKNFPGVTMDINDLNQSPYLLGVADGVIELRKDGAVLREATPGDFVTLNTNTVWTGWAGIPSHDRGKKMWEEYLDRFVPDSRRDDYQTILGHTILGGNPERLILILMGGTSTGKSTMLRAMGAALGDYAATVNLTIFENHKLNPALANAMPKRVVFTSELSAGDKLAVAAVKRMTGSDIIRAELKGSNVEVQGIPQFVPIMATNTPPEIAGADEALRKRLLVLPFDERIDDRKDEKRASHDLELHAGEAILAWLVEGYNRYCEVGIPNNIEINRVTNEFTGQLDPVNEFMAERTRGASEQEHTSTGEMFAAYKKWCEVSNVDKRDWLSKNQFSRRLTGLGYTNKPERVSGKLTRCWTGVRLTRVIVQPGQDIKSVPFKTEKEADDAGTAE